MSFDWFNRLFGKSDRSAHGLHSDSNLVLSHKLGLSDLCFCKSLFSSQFEELTCPKRIDILTFWFAGFGLVLVMTPQG